eukprot:CAMPEP_0118899532 /NCGR_PEP_ID=MMETSP1166-20130328/6048_1 /TAXON_ID=1104430 /ORGANISM="Chrysoreinhardia sp, Strain CCMP3193" /LENGTH=249 /DNA_ID=CAMNT_0006838663 /DNA_START=5 /DNA_END=754 /DNA_ORIENTATION=+
MMDESGLLRMTTTTTTTKSPPRTPPLRKLNDNLDELVTERRRTSPRKTSTWTPSTTPVSRRRRKGGVLASPETVRQHAQNLKELETLNLQNSKLRRDIQRVTASKVSPLKDLQREKIMTTLEIWHKGPNPPPVVVETQTFEKTQHSQDDAMDTMDTYAKDISDLRRHIRDNDAKLETIKTHCDQRVEKAQLELRLCRGHFDAYKEEAKSKTSKPATTLLVAAVFLFLSCATTFLFHDCRSPDLIPRAAH